MKKTYVYSDPLRDDFAGPRLFKEELPEGYEYLPSRPTRRAMDFILHHGIATPIVYLFQHIVYGERIINRKALKPYRKSGFFLYGNHTRAAGDAFAPHLIAFPRKAYILINADAVAIPGVRHLVKSLGGLPVASKLSEVRRFHKVVCSLSPGNCIAIYPEAHIWPYYTGIRPFIDASFRYPAETGQPVFAFTVTYQKRLLFSHPRTTVYIDGPYFPDPARSVRENQRLLRDQVYEAMCRRAEASTYSYNTYIPEVESARYASWNHP